MRGGICLFGLWGLCFGLGCGAAEPAAREPVTVGGGAVVVIFNNNDRGPAELPFDPRAERLMAATDQLAGTVGHPVTFELDMALLPQWHSSFENALASSIENLTRDLRRLQQRRPQAYAFVAPKLQRVDYDYDAAAEGTSARFDDREGTLYLSGPASPVVSASVQPTGSATPLIEAGLAEDALWRGYVASLERRFDGVSPEQVPPGELEVYWEYLQRSSAFVRTSASPKGMADDPGARKITYEVRLAARVPNGQPALRDAVRAKLLGEAHFFTSAYQRDPLEVDALGPQTLWREAERAWAGWLNERLPSLSDAERTALLFAPLYVRAATLPKGDRPHPETMGYPPSAYPGVDRLGFALQVVDRWITAGHPVGAPTDSPRSLYDTLVCPMTRDGLGRQGVIGSRCDNGFYTYAVASPADRERLVAAMIERDDEAFTSTAIMNLVTAGKEYAPRLHEVWHALEPSRSAWMAATMVLAEAAMGGSGLPPATVYDEAPRLWRQYPDRRGAVLYLLTSLEPYVMGRTGLVNWSSFATAFGGKIGGAELGAYLATSPMAVTRLPGLWEALASGYSRAALIVPALDAYMDDRASKAYDNRSPYGALKDLSMRLCADHADADRATLRAYLLARIAKAPSEEAHLRALADRNAPGRCGGAAGPSARD